MNLSIIKLFFSVGVIFFLFGCLTVDTKCCDFISSYPISDSLYIEKYKTFCAGVFGEGNDYYITDSTKFRAYIGSSDEHSILHIKLQDNIVKLFTLESKIIMDTLEQKSVLKSELIASHQFDSISKKTMPLFGINQNPCKNFVDYSKDEIDKGFYLIINQHQCGSSYLNVVYLTDNLNFRKLIGFYDAGMQNPQYSVKANSDKFLFYQTSSKSVNDTTSYETLKLDSLRKGKLIVVCSKK